MQKITLSDPVALGDETFISTKCLTLDNIALALFNLMATLLIC